MRIRSNLKGTKGWLSMWEAGIRFRHMRNKAEVDRRLKILGFWETHGDQATKDAFGVSRRTLFRWQAVLQSSKGKLDALDPKSTALKKRRKRVIAPDVEDFIIRERTEHPGLGKEKLAVLLKEEGHAVSVSYVGRVLKGLKERKLLPSGKRLSFHARSGRHHERLQVRRKKLRRKQKRGLELDTVVRFIDGTKRYILTAVDVERKFAFAGAYTSHSSSTAADFLRRLVEVCPFPVSELQTDNGSEFALRFREACEHLGLTHFHTYPRSPKMNGCVERFNRTLWHDFAKYRRPLLRDDVQGFNEALVDWLLWYNTRRPHASLEQVSPLRYIVSTLTAGECQKYWTRTIFCQLQNGLVRYVRLWEKSKIRRIVPKS